MKISQRNTLTEFVIKQICYYWECLSEESFDFGHGFFFFFCLFLFLFELFILK